MSKEIIKFGSKVEECFDAIELNENESKGLMIVAFTINSKTKDIVVVNDSIGNKLDIVEVLTLLLKSKKELEFQNLFEAVKEFI